MYRDFLSKLRTNLPVNDNKRADLDDILILGSEWESLVREIATRKAIGVLLTEQPNPIHAGIDEYQKFNRVRNELIDECNAEREAQQ